MHEDEQQAHDTPAPGRPEQTHEQEEEMQQMHDTSGLADKLRQVQNEVESRELERTIRLDRARGHLDSAATDDQGDT